MQQDKSSKPKLVLDWILRYQKIWLLCEDWKAKSQQQNNLNQYWNSWDDVEHYQKQMKKRQETLSCPSAQNFYFIPHELYFKALWDGHGTWAHQEGEH